MFCIVGLTLIFLGTFVLKLHFLKKLWKLVYNCFIFILNMPHIGFIYESHMAMMENSGNWCTACECESCYNRVLVNCLSKTKRLLSLLCF